MRHRINSLIDQGKPPALPVDSQKFDICGSRHSGSPGGAFEPGSRAGIQSLEARQDRQAASLGYLN
jgi:hypothetical protein